ncbi:MAG: tyrosinase family protein [Nitrosospira sp.]|nr:tyrosinase family protein [Nitrosospira sp.]
MGHRQNLNTLPAAERQALVELILQYLNDAIVAAHTTITHSGEHILTGHRQYIEELEAFLTAQGGARFVPLPAWNSANPIPAEFSTVKPQDDGTPRPSLINLNPNIPMPSQYTPPAVCNFASLTDLGNDINGWHGSVHVTIGGTMGSLAIASAAPIFWCWHAFVDEIYWDYQNQCQSRSDSEIILFEHINFHGRHKHVYSAEPNLNAGDDSFFNDRVSSMIVLGGNWEVFRHSQYQEPYPVVLGPGLHPWVGAIGIANDDMSSLRPTSRAATVEGQPSHAHAILFEHANFHGAHKHVFNEEQNLASSDDSFFNDRTSSIVILLDTWEAYRHINFIEPYPRTLGVGLHPWVVDAQIENDDLSSIRHAHGDAQQAGTPIVGHMVMFEHANFHGEHKHLFRDEPNFNAGDDSFFNDKVSSLAVRQSSWRCFRHAGYVAPYSQLLVQGLYPWVGALGITNDDMSSARIE